MAISKRCFQCGLEKSLDSFYTHPGMADGHLNKCKDCVKAAVGARYREMRPERSEYEKRRSQEPERKAAQQVMARRHRQQHPAKYKARTAVNNALRDRRLFRGPCEAAGCEAKKVQAHHADYSRPLDVKWLCFKHHREQEHGQVVTSF